MGRTPRSSSSECGGMAQKAARGQWCGRLLSRCDWSFGATTGRSERSEALSQRCGAVGCWGGDSDPHCISEFRRQLRISRGKPESAHSAWITSSETLSKGTFCWSVVTLPVSWSTSWRRAPRAGFVAPVARKDHETAVGGPARPVAPAIEISRQVGRQDVRPTVSRNRDLLPGH